MDSLILFLQEISVPLALVGLIQILQAFTEAPKDITFDEIDKQIQNKTK
jgi:hypothetical protein